MLRINGEMYRVIVRGMGASKHGSSKMHNIASSLNTVCLDRWSLGSIELSIKKLSSQIDWFGGDVHNKFSYPQDM